MSRFLTLASLMALAAVIFYLWRNARLQNVVRRRFEGVPWNAQSHDAHLPEPRSAKPLLRRHWVLPWLVGTAGGALYFVFGIREIYSGTGAVVLALMAWQVEAMLADPPGAAGRSAACRRH